MAPPETIERDTTAKVVAERLRQDIQQGRLAPGTRLRQNEVAKRFGVSTTPVREAFAQLEAEGLVRIDPHRGAVVFHPTVEDVLEFYEIREVLESLAVAHAIPNLDDDAIEELRKLVDQMRRTEDPMIWLRLNDEFHLSLYEAAGRPRLTSLIENMRDASIPYIHMFVATHPLTQRGNDEHEAILAACVERNSQAAKRWVREHLRRASRDLAAFIQTHAQEAGEG